MKVIVFDKENPEDIILHIEAETEEDAIQKAYDQIGNKALTLTFKQEEQK